MKFLFSNHLIRASLAPQPPTLFKGVLELFGKLLKEVEIMYPMSGRQRRRESSWSFTNLLDLDGVAAGRTICVENFVTLLTKVD
jgi:hypothetical protein